MLQFLPFISLVFALTNTFATQSHLALTVTGEYLHPITMGESREVKLLDDDKTYIIRWSATFPKGNEHVLKTGFFRKTIGSTRNNSLDTITPDTIITIYPESEHSKEPSFYYKPFTNELFRANTISR